MFTFKFADIGEGIHEGKVFEFFVKEGDIIKEGDNLLSVETDKMTADIPSPVSGKIIKILVKQGETIHVGQDMFQIDDGSSKTEAASEPKKEDSKKETVEEGGASVVGEVKISNDLLPSLFGPKKTSQNNDKTESSVNIAPSTSSTVINGVKVLATPLARAIASAKGIDITMISGTGPNGRVLKDDVLGYESKKDSAPNNNQKPTLKSSPSEFFGNESERREKASGVRKAIAKSMKNSWSTNAYTNLVTEIDVTELVRLRASVKDQLLEEGIKITYLPYIVKAIAKSLVLHHKLNSKYDYNTEEIVYYRDINIGVAVDAPNGLFVPVIKNANHLSVTEIALEINSLAKQTREGKLSPSSMKGGTFTVTNYGSVGSLFGVPVINSPELAIAGIGTFVKRPKFSKDGTVVEGHFLYLTVAADHQWVDGADIGRFGQSVKRLLENPSLLLH
jgi:pyruvate dehydrogenase E2 component (dihydrolipoamide acetyltransferase)